MLTKYRLHLLLGVVCVLLVGCLTPPQFRRQADDVAYDIIRQKQQLAIEREEPFWIETPSNTLRRRLIARQMLPVSHPASIGSDQLSPLEHWPKDDYLRSARTTAEPIVSSPPGEPIRLTLIEALQVAARNSREYQSEKESVFSTALSLDLDRDGFRTSWAGAIDNTLSYDSDSSPETITFSTTPRVSFSQSFEDGLDIAGSISWDLINLLTQGGDGTSGISADLSATLPLLAGSGRHIVRESLTQAERDMIYALWDFERFKRSFVVSIASSYLSVLQQEDQVDNALSNYRSLISSYQRAQSLSEEGRLPEIQVDQAKQDVLRARNSWINARASLQRQMDNFKLTLGLPTDAEIELDRGELERLAATAAVALGGSEEEADEQAEYVIEDGKVVILEPSNRDAGPLELPESELVSLAMDRRLDLRRTQEEVEDAQRRVVVAADALQASLTVRVSGSTSNSDTSRLEPEEGLYSVELDYDAPWDKEPERNSYRTALIDLERAVRSVQSNEDRVKLDIRNALRTLRQARESYKIQSQSLVTAQRRVDSTQLLLQLGRTEIRNVLEAQEDLIDAQNALTAALVDYRIAELELQRDTGVLIVNERGLWTEYRSESDERDNGEG